LKMTSPLSFVETPRARALLAACGVAAIAITSVGTAEGVRAAAPSTTLAQSQLFGVHPVQEGQTTLPGGHFNFALVPGQRISDGIVVENFSGHPLRFNVYGADVLTATGGGLAPAQSTSTMHAVGAWIVVSTPTVTIAAHGRATDEFTITVPVTASAGEHLGAVVAAADVGVTAQGTPIEARAALITVVTVPGTVRPSAILTALLGSGASAGRFRFAITLLNTGNVLLTYAGSVTIDDADGRTVAKISLTPTNAYVVPSGRVPLAVMWREPATLAATYHAHATVTFLANGVAVGTLTSQSLAVLFPSGLSLRLLAGMGLAILLIMVLAAWTGLRIAHWQHRAGVRRVLGTETGRLR
jgi:hypothetical protein